MTSLMAAEIAECPRVARESASQDAVFGGLSGMFHRAPPSLVVLCGRGSSGHAALYLRYLVETRLLVPVSLAAPSVFSASGARVRLDGAWFIVISQSGDSPDLVAAARAARESGALTIAFVNTPDSTLGGAVDLAVSLRAGPEKSVAATKSVLAAMASGARMVAEIAGDDTLHAALDLLPRRIEAALACDWSVAERAIAQARVAYVTGRGLGLAVAKEVALKITEALRIPALAYSAAEILHGPRAAIGVGSLVLGFAVDDGTAPSVRHTMQELALSGARTLTCGGELPWIGDDHPATDAIAMLPPAWSFIESCAARLGYDVDRPPFLSKVTRTL